MNRAKRVRLMVAVATLFLSTSAFAAAASVGIINGGSVPVNQPFTVEIEVHDSDGFPDSPATATNAALHLVSGSGTLGGTTSGTIFPGSSSLTLSGVTYDVAETITIEVIASGGDPLVTEPAATFNVLSSTITVTTTADSGAGSLRAAINTVNARGCWSPCTIRFAPGGTGTIALSSPLPALVNIFDELTIDGYTAAGASPNTAPFGAPSNAVVTVTLDGGNSVATGLDIQMIATIRGLAFRRFTSEAIKSLGGSTIAGCLIGTDGSVATPNQTGILIQGNGGLIGGPQPADRNVISGNTTWGVLIENTQGMWLQGNYVGVNAAATASIANGSGGVSVDALSTGILVGINGVGNVISGNTTGIGLRLDGPNAAFNNRIGTDGAGLVAVPNATGVWIRGAGIVAGDVGAPSIISGNSGVGIVISGNFTSVYFCAIGVSDTRAPLGNGSHGIHVIGTSARGNVNNNVIAYNGDDGVSLLTTGAGAQIISNEIYANGGLGIDLDDDGVTPNDPGDADTGANNRQNFPAISAASVDGGDVTLTLSLDSSAAGSTGEIAIDVYKADSSSPPQGLTIIGRVLLNSASVTNGTFTFPSITPVAAGDAIVATATSYSTFFNVTDGTSEFSAPFTLTGPKHWIAQNGTWETAGNWSPAGVPTANDDVLIDNSGTYTVTINSAATAKNLKVGGVSGTQTLNVVAGQSLSIVDVVNIAAGDVLLLDGTVSGAGALNISGALNWRGGTIAGAGGLTFGSTATVTLSTSGTKTLDQRTLTIPNGVTVNWTGGALQLQNGGAVSNAGTFNVQTNASIVNGGGAGTFTNTGLFHKLGTAGTTTFDHVTFHHGGGTVDIDTGVLELAGGTATSTFDLAAGTELLLGSSTPAYVFAAGANQIGAGLVHVTTGRLDVDGPSVTLAHVQLDDPGTIAGSGLLRYTTFLWNGGMMTGSGTTEGAAASTMTIAGTPDKVLERMLRTLNGATVVLTGTGLRLDAAGAVNNAGLWDAQAGFGFLNIGSSGAFTNSGTFRVSGGSGVSFSFFPFNHSGTVDVQQAQLSLGYGSSTGAFALAAGTALVFGDPGGYAFNAGTTVSGAGAVVVPYGLLAVNAAVSLPNFTLSGGTLGGGGTLTLTGAALWSAGVIDGGGAVEVASGATLDIASILPVTLSGRTLRTLGGGTTHWTSGAIQMTAASTIENAGLFWAQVGNSIDDNGIGSFTNTGELRVEGGVTIGVPLLNTTGTVRLLNGILTADGGYTQSTGGTLEVHLSGTSLGTQYSQLASSLPPALAGTLRVALDGPYQPTGGDTFNVVAFNGAANGDFTHPYSYPVLTGGRTFSDAFVPLTGLVLTVIGAPDLSITKSASAPSVVTGTPISYTITVNNGGSEPAIGAQVIDTLPSGHTSIGVNGNGGWNCNVSGDTVTCNALNSLGGGNAPDIVINALAPLQVQTFTNTATVTSTNDANGANNSGSVTVTVGSNESEVYLSGNGPTGPVPMATPLPLTFTLANGGPQTATGVRFTATIPTALTYTSASLPGGTCSFAAQLVTCTLASLPLAGSVDATVSLMTTVSGIFNVTGSIDANEPDPIPFDNSLTYAINVTNNTVTISSTADSGPGSLRQALLDAQSGLCPAPCTIVFNLPTTTAPPYRIQLSSDLPPIGSGVIVDGATQPGYGGVPAVEIDGASASPSTHLFHITGNGSMIRGLSIINGPGDGIRISGNDNRIENCYVGLRTSGAPAPNGMGIRILGGGNTVGGPHSLTFGIKGPRALAIAAGGNVIANNTNGGVVVASGAGNEISGNSIYGHPSLGIDLGGDGPDSIDAGDGDSGANGKQNSPTLTSASLSAGNVTVHYAIDASATTAKSILVEFFEADSAASGEGISLLAGVCAASNQFADTASFAAAGVTNGDAIVATATSFTDTTCTTIGDGTSEFSNAVLIVVPPCTPASATVSGSTAICAGTSTNISATLTGTPPFNVTWSDGFVQTIPSGTTATRSVSPSSTTTYTITSITDASCATPGVGTGSAVITVTPSPLATITAPATVVPGSTGNLASVASQAGAVYAWSITNGVITSATNANAVTFSAGPSGTVVLDVSVTASSCTSTGSASIATAAPASDGVPTLSVWMLVALGMALAAAGAVRMR